uniref:GARS_A domain-containing protein n=1 Tax=Macrostomum lignano TaxID=282301 RepID=A0A1I8FIC3_9PLAT
DLAAIEAIAASLSSLPFKPLVAQSERPSSRDGERVSVLPPARDRKRRFDGDCGPNTGGMGAAAPRVGWILTGHSHLLLAISRLIKSLLSRLERDFLQRAIDGLRAEGRRFVGALYAGLIRADCVHGLPSTRPVAMPTVRVSLAAVLVQQRPYPASCPGRYPVQGLDSFANQPGDPLLAFHAGHRLRTLPRLLLAARPDCYSGRSVCNLRCRGQLAPPNAGPLCACGARRARRIRFLGVDWRRDIAGCVAVGPGPVAQFQSGCLSLRIQRVNVAEGDHLVDLDQTSVLSHLSHASSALVSKASAVSRRSPTRLNNCSGAIFSRTLSDPSPVLGVRDVDAEGRN